MGTGADLASQAENQLFAHELAAEEQEYADHPEFCSSAATAVAGDAGITLR
jgi:hypothetical protein